MDLQNEWNQMNNEVVANSDNLGIAGAKLKTESLSVLSQIRKRLNVKLMWARGISLLFFIGFIFADAQVRYWILAVLLAYGLGIYLSKKQMKTIKYDLDFAEATKTILTEQLRAIQQTLKIERVWGLFVIPFMGPVGFMVSNLAKGKEAVAILSDPKMLAIIIGLALLGVPLIYLSEKMNNKAFGAYLAKLESQLEQMEA